MYCTVSRHCKHRKQSLNMTVLFFVLKKDTICFTISEGLCKSMTLLWMRIWKRSQVLEPSPQGVLRVVMRRIFVGIRTGPFTRRVCFFAPLIKSAHTGGNKKCIHTHIYHAKCMTYGKYTVLNVLHMGYECIRHTIMLWM